MANYYATARSSYFTVKDTMAFEAWCKAHNLHYWTNTDGCYTITPDDDPGHWPLYEPELDENDDEVEFDLETELSKHLATNQVAILIEVGSEKLRYLTGHTVAIHADGRTCHISLQDIYAQAQSTFGDDVTITRAEY